jgi:hypothetical protein
MTHTINHDKTAAVATDVFWIPIASCPMGLKILLLTVHGVAIVGHYTEKLDKGFYTHWHPLPKKPKE